MRCNICGGATFLDMPKRPQVRCADCGSLERTRVAALYLQGSDRPTSNASILHFAPERGLSHMLRRIGGANYQTFDINPALYPGLGVEPFDLARDVFDLPLNAFDLILHNHVLEHVEGNYTAILLRLMKSLSDEGVMLFSVPILPGGFSDELLLGTEDEKRARFGDSLHVRRFGRDVLQQTLGMIFHIPERYDLPARFPVADLDAANVPRHHWLTYTGASIFRVTKADLRV